MDDVVDSHRVVLATLEEDVGESARLVREDAQVSRMRLVAPSEQEALERHLGPLRQERRERGLVAAQLRPLPPSQAARLDPPLVTRGGVLYVPPAFEAAAGLDADVAERLIRSGFRSVDAFLDAPEAEIAEVTGRSIVAVRRARRDLDLMRLPHVDRKAADLLRLADCATVSRLAGMDPALIVRDLERIGGRHRFLEMPAVIDGEQAVRRLVAAAQARAE